jgi:UDP-N-acetylmuramoylalanine--D-glutamate ligase
MPIAILGLGKTGLSLAKYFSDQGEEVWGIDDNQNLNQKSLHPPIHQFFLGGKLPNFKKLQRFFISPGINPKHPAAQQALASNLKLEGELEFAFTLCKRDVIAITGTNGKSTTVSLLGAIYQAAGEKVGVGGNLGTPFLDLVTDPKNFSKFILEISSYQLETISTFRPMIGAILNVTEDHLDRYENFKDYLAAKDQLFEFQHPDDMAVYNDDDLHVLEAVENISSQRLPFSTVKKIKGTYLKDQKILWAPEGKIQSSFDLSKCKLMGLHNLENIACAIACAKADGIQDEPIQKTLEAFPGLPHRIEWVAEINGVNYFDDSKATNVGAVVMSLASFDQNVVLILGGKDKGGDYSPLKPLIKNKVASLIMMGEAKEKILKALGNIVPTYVVASMHEAVEKSHQSAKPGGVVLLSPACSSFDMFKDYHDRGEQFRAEVRKLK